MNDASDAARYRVGTIGWPDGWEPEGPLDVPNCILAPKTAVCNPLLAYGQAETIVHSLNRQCIDAPGTVWYVVVAETDASVSQISDADPGGQRTSIAVDPSRVIRPQRGTAGDCSCCPAHNLPCAQGN